MRPGASEWAAWLAAAAFSAALLASCESGGDGGGFRDPALDTPPPPGPAGEVLKVEIPGEASVTLNLAGSAYLALARNRSLAALRLEIESKTGFAVQADKAPNPRLSVSAQTPVGEGILIGGTIEMSQIIELGKRGARTDVASSETEVAKAVYFLRRNEVLLEVRQAMIEALAASAEEELKSSAAGFNDRLYKLKALMYREGKAARQQEIDASVALEKSIIDLEAARRKRKDALRAIEALCDLPPRSVKAVIGDLGRAGALPPEARIQRAALIGNPILVSFDRKAALASAKVKAAEAKPIPDVSVGAIYMRKRGPNEDGHSVGLGISIPVPLWDSNAGEIRAWTAALAAVREDRKESENRILLEISRAASMHRENFVKLVEYERVIIPGLEKKLALAVLGRETGRSSMADELSAQIELADGAIQHLAATTACLLATAKIESLMGSTLEAEGSTD